MKLPKVSVVMPVYNTPEEYLRPAIESVLNQTFTDFEFLIVDDGSTDKSVSKTIASYSDKRIKYFYKENSGIADTLNFGLSKAKGTYIARMDGDDICLPKRFEKQVAFLDNHPDVSLVSALYERFPEPFTPHHPERVGLLDLMVKGCVITHPLVMLRKQVFEKENLLYDPSYACEDYELWSRSLMKGLKFDNIQEVLLKYRWHPQNLSHLKQKKIETDSQKIKERIVHFLSDDPNIQKELCRLFDYHTPPKKIYFCGLYLFKVKTKENKKKYYLFGSIPILTIKGKNGRKTKINTP